MICCFNTVQSLLTDAELAAFFRSVRSLVGPEGVFAFDIMQPDLLFLSGRQHDHLARALTDEKGQRIEHRRKYSYDPKSRVLTIDHRMIEPARRAAVPLARLRQKYRQYSTAEIERALIAASFVIRERYGDFDRSILGEASKKQIFVCLASQLGHNF